MQRMLKTKHKVSDRIWGLLKHSQPLPKYQNSDHHKKVTIRINNVEDKEEGQWSEMRASKTSTSPSQISEQQSSQKSYYPNQ
jgi:hypothetical protein